VVHGPTTGRSEVRHCLRIEDLGGVERERECPDVGETVCVHRRGAFDRDVRVRH
jgi:hypothetical protein